MQLKELDSLKIFRTSEIKNLNIHQDLEKLVARRTSDLIKANEKLSHEIEERIKVEEALKSVEYRYHKIIDAITDYIFTVQIENNKPVKTLHYPSCKAITGYSPADFEKNPYLWIQMVPEEDRELVKDQIQGILSGRSYDSIEHRIIRNDGAVRWVRNKPVPFFSDSGVLISYDGIIRDVTNRKLSEISLRESEEKFRILAEKSPNMIFINKNGQIVYANERCEKAMGYRREDFYSSEFNFMELVALRDQKKVSEMFQKHLKGEEIEPYEYTLITKTGQEIDSIITTKLIDYQGDKAILGVITDISEQKRIEMVLKRRLEFEKTISMVSSRFVDPIDLDDTINESLRDIGTYSRASRAYFFIFNSDYSRMDNLQEWCADGVAPQIHNLKNLPTAIFPWWMKKLNKGEIIHINDVSKLPLQAKNERDILEKQNIKSLIVLPLKISNKLRGFIGFDNVLHTAVWTNEDLTLLKIFSEILGNAFERKHTEETLRLSDLRNQALLEAMPDTMMVLSKGGKIKDVKAAEDKFFRLPLAECINKNLNDTEFTKDQVRLFFKQIKIVLSTKKMQTLQVELDRPGGRQTYEIRMTYLNEKEVLTNVRNITHQKELEEEFIKNDKLESLGVLAGGIAHDFNNLLTAILGNISLAKIYQDSHDKLMERLNAAEKASGRARDLTQQLLTFSKGGEPIKKTLCIGNLIQEAASFALRGSGEVFRLTRGKDIWPVEVDAGQMSQVIQNLLINADQAMPKGGIIHISCENHLIDSKNHLPLKAGKYVKITIKDNGTGIPKEYISKIFDPYFSTKQKGSGLGLATVYSIINKHDGYITVESIPGKGTTFYIYIPASNKKIVGHCKSEVNSYEASGKILIVDDEEVVRKIAASMLTKLGFEVDFAFDGKQALKMYKSSQRTNQTYSAILMDLTIPGGMGGKETIKKLLKIDPGVKAIVSSGYSNDPIMSNYSHYGFRGVIAKPYKFEELSQVIKQIFKL
jgi:PAS domain S-box-containing protein